MSGRNAKPGPVFDAHLHIIDPRFPLVGDHGYRPKSFTVADYLARVTSLNIVGGAVVSGSFQGTDQDYLIDALIQLGVGWVGVTQLSPKVSDERIRELDKVGVRAIRFNLVRGGRVNLDELITLGRRVAEVAGWHVECYLDTRDLPELTEKLAVLPRISIDHLGLSAAGLPALLRLVEGGARVKATGFGRVELDILSTLRAIHKINPEALIFGTDLPSTRAPRPFFDSDVSLIHEAIGDSAAKQVLYDNALAHYQRTGLKATGSTL